MRQEIIATLGRLDLQESGQLDRLLRSGLRYCRQVKVLDAHAAGETEPVSIMKIGPELVFGRLWQDMGIAELISQVAAERRYGFDLERAVYLTVLFFVSGSDRAAEERQLSHNSLLALPAHLAQNHRMDGGRRPRGHDRSYLLRLIAASLPLPLNAPRVR